MRRALGLLTAVVLATGTITACGSDSNSITAQAKKGDDKGYIAGDGGVEQLAANKRGKPVNLSGTLLDGKQWSIDEDRGKVVVLNVWGSWCKPCQGEVPALEQAYRGWQQAKSPVTLIGMAQRDPSPENARAALRQWGGTYPSLADDGGKGLLQLQGKVVATPTTLVLDKQHRIAARVSGPVTATTVRELVSTVLAEKS